MKHFNKAILEIDEADNQVIMTTFQAGLSNLDLVFSLGKTPPTTVADLLFKAHKYVNGEDTLSAKGLIGKRKKEEASDSQNKKKDQKDHLSDTKSSKNSPEVSKKKLNFTPPVMPANKILMQIKDEPGLRWPKPLSSSSKKRDMKKYYRFHKDHGHYTNECCDLKEQIEELIQRGKSQKFVKIDHQSRSKAKEKSHDDNKDDGRDHPKQAVGEIRMITGGLVSRGSYKSLRRAH